MYLKTLVRSALACTVITLASACGSSDSTGPDYDSTVTPADAEGAANQGYLLMNSMMSGIYSLDFGISAEAVKGQVIAGFAAIPPITTAPVGEGPWRRTLDAGQLFAASFPTPGLQRSASPGCTYSESGASAPGEPLDANGNDFPDDWHLQVVCVTTEEGTGDTVITVREVEDILVRERPQDLLGYEVRAVMLLRFQDNHENFQEQEQRQEILLSIRSGGVTQHQLQSGSLRSHMPGATETTVKELFVSGDAGYDPFSPIVLANPLPDGHLTLNGEVHKIDTDIDLALRFLLDTPTPLEFDRSCAESNDQPFVDGVLRGRLNGNGQVGFRISFNPCGSEPDYETFGIEGGPVAPKFMTPRFHP